ncbi:lipid-A-disaccharide synthase [Gilvimarinus agarilyticus]|uniref:lipid-A-disaccharide synthase n=1 Tax=unclassified Gilvimarinus TaxID=2642066 RepID=UPI001C0830C5|nr:MULTISPECIES: lipid-A-disaccharide synthase [unclassified Gilvimarinus]MBU2886984.1 lipid-A-disaccharide synthase [Gilvimarinus agarilyticus]MDO6571644.1 lipid-A-disaccharide synthase [Gilvimarinus sp. 2_MG-2023]MDO6745716.1 lipid-A-disaccharide synthase [Gilvimarinus sp. 1_MG-2023]
MNRTIRIGIVAGEASGDLLGAGLIQALKHHYPHVEFSGIGGPKMLAEGFHSFFPQDRLAVMGLIDPLKRLPELLKIRRFLFEHFSEQAPDVFIGIDSPDFNLTLEQNLRKSGIKTVHYVSPSVWAWRSGRIKKIKRAVDLMLTILPFETAIYQQHQVPVKFVGHPLADSIPMQPDKHAARKKLQLDASSAVVALMPGSRHSEVERLGPLFFQAAKLMLKQRPGLRFVLPAASGQRYKQLHQMLGPHSDLPVTLVQGQSHDVMAAADVVLLASGTTALEAMLLKKPMVVSYKMAWLSFKIMRAMALVRFVSLPNLLADREVVPELLQADADPEQMSEAVLRYFNQPELTAELVETFTQQHQSLKCNANQTAAAALIELIKGQE